ncbi:MAG: pyridoxamine 5'-phosphate oxidase family protein [Flavobacteriales bacterium]|nr:pyridoxamine 5'-phosphate oxidase family protein [Flavobacteriales bacterium]
MMKIETEQELRALYKQPSERAAKKCLPRLDPHATRFIQRCPFAIIATYDSSGRLDASPRGGRPGFIHVVDEQTLLVPDAKGNNRLDSLTNILQTGRIASLFLIPGMDETLRLNGHAEIRTDAELLVHFASEKNPPISCIQVHVEEVFLHCAKAFMRSRLWDNDTQIDRSEFPPLGQMLTDQLNIPNTESDEEMLERYKKEL